MQIVIDIPEDLYKNCIIKKDINDRQREHNGAFNGKSLFEVQLVNYIANGTPLEKHDEEVIKETVESIWGKPPYTEVLDKIRAEIMDCLKALDEIEKSGFNIYLPNEISGRRLTYKQCLGFIDKYIAGTE
jgi:hypothetical protein